MSRYGHAVFAVLVLITFGLAYWFASGCDLTVGQTIILASVLTTSTWVTVAGLIAGGYVLVDGFFPDGIQTWRRRRWVDRVHARGGRITTYWNLPKGEVRYWFSGRQYRQLPGKELEDLGWLHCTKVPEDSREMAAPLGLVALHNRHWAISLCRTWTVPGRRLYAYLGETFAYNTDASEGDEGFAGVCDTPLVVPLDSPYVPVPLAILESLQCHAALEALVTKAARDPDLGLAKIDAP